MRSAYISFSYRDPEVREYVDYLREHLRFTDVEPIDVQLSLFPSEELHRSITDSINRCSVFVCFLDVSNPNVMFELGYAFAKNKHIVIVSDDISAIPFDVQNSLFVQRNVPPSKLIRQIESRIYEHRESNQLEAFPTHEPDEMLSMLSARADILDSIDGDRFTGIIGDWFERHGCAVFPQSYPESGYDFRVEPFRGATAAVEVKKYKTSSQVSISVVRQLVGAMSLENIPIGIIVSSAPFTRSAISFAHEIPPDILLWTLDDMTRIEGGLTIA
jgi:hypothetical protein